MEICLTLRTRCGRWTLIPRAAVLLLLLAGWPPGSVYAAGDTPESGARAPIGMGVWDTGQPSREPLAPAALAAKKGWVPVSPRGTTPSFRGDAIVSNGRITAVVRKHSPGVEIYSEGPDGPAARLRLLLLTPGGEPAAQLVRATVAENTRAAACLDIAGQTAGGTSLAARFRLKRGEVFVQTEPGPGAGRLRVECPGRFAVLPDFFADDILIDARRLPVPAIEVPSDNFVLHATGAGDALGLCVFENRRQDVRLILGGEGEGRAVTGSEVDFEGKKIWVAVLAAPHVWYQRDIQAGDAGKVLPLDWRMPFPAQWRVDFTRADGLTDSWEMLLQERKNGKYIKPSWLGGREETLPLNRERWNTFLNTFLYPCWSDPEGRGYVQPLVKSAFQFRGPAVVYPINRVRQTPPEAYTVVDVMRNTLGAGPCEHVLDVEGQRTQYLGRPTCGVQGLLEEIYSKHEQKQKRAEVEKDLDDGLAFVTHIRSRINRYLAFGRQMRAYLAQQKKAHPELATSLAELDRLVQRLDTRVAPLVEKIPPPDYVVRLNDDFRKRLLGYDGPDALDRCKQYGKALTDIGGDQDELVGECRWVVRTLRQRAGLLTALDPRLAAIAGEIRARTQEVLRNPAGYEWSRH